MLPKSRKQFYREIADKKTEELMKANKPKKVALKSVKKKKNEK